MDRTSAANFTIIGGKRQYRDRNWPAGIEGTSLTAADRNAVQEELLAVIEWAALTPAAADLTQLLQAIQRIAGAAGISIISATTTLTAADVGRLLVKTGATAVTATLPVASTVPAGTGVNFFCSGAGTVTVAAGGSDSIRVGGALGTASVTSLPVTSGGTLELISDGSGVWYPASGSAQLANTADFAAGFGTTGRQRLPSGLLLQWGRATLPASGSVTSSTAAVVFPVAFPNACHGGLATATGGSNTPAGFPPVPLAYGFSTTGMTVGGDTLGGAGGTVSWNTAVPMSWLAWGN